VPVRERRPAAHGVLGTSGCRGESLEWKWFKKPEQTAERTPAFPKPTKKSSAAPQSPPQVLHDLSFKWLYAAAGVSPSSSRGYFGHPRKICVAERAALTIEVRAALTGRRRGECRGSKFGAKVALHQVFRTSHERENSFSLSPVWRLFVSLHTVRNA